ncbi:MAG: transcriptional regulator [Bacteroidetes bacterium]|nr:transcriptional regulator [Bacteroidota bacterium]
MWSIGLFSSVYGNDPVKFGQPRVINFPKSTYQADNQNWCIDQDEQGTMYFANNDGLLTFDGISWKTYPLPDKMIMRSLDVQPAGRIFTGSYEEFGFWERDKRGELQYTSLTPLLRDFTFQNEEIWKIITWNGITYFQSFSVIFAYNGKTVSVIRPPGLITCFSRLHDQLYLLIEGQGLYTLQESLIVPADSAGFFREKMIRVMLPYAEGKMLIATADDGIFVYDKEGKVLQWGSGQEARARKSSINRGTVTKNGMVIIGTILNGILIYDQQGILVFHLNKQNGLQHNTVLDVFMDSDGSLWAALDNGIDLISPESNLTFYYDPTGVLGSVYAMQIRDNILYAGTNQGLFYSRFDPASESLNLNFQLMENSQGQVWSLDNFDNQMLCGHNEGTFEVQGARFIPVSAVNGGFSCCKFIHDAEEYLLQSTYTDLVVYKKQNGKWRFSHAVRNFMNPVRHIQIDHLGNIWAGHLLRGLYRLKLSDDLTSVTEKKQYGSRDGFASDYHINVFTLENRIVFTNEGKVYTYNDLYDSIMVFDFIQKGIKDNSFVTGIFPAGEKKYWFSTASALDLYEINSGEVIRILSVPFEQLDNKLIRHNENIFTVAPDKWLIGLENGMALISPDSGKNNIVEKTATINKVVSTGKRETILLPEYNRNSGMPEFRFNQNGVAFYYSCPVFRSSMRFLVKLDGIDEEWIQTGLPVFKYDRLPWGNYTFRVKAFDTSGNTSKEGHFSFVISSPWYWSFWSKMVYILLLSAFILAIRIYILRRLKEQEIKLGQEKERALIKLKNEKLESEIHFKSMQLANTTYSMIKKNEMLLEIKKLLGRSKRNIDRADWNHFKDVLSLLDRNITSEDDWKVFESNFEQAHEEFLQRIKKTYPDLTPGDLKLCAYIRMNLSSKKIAPLLGISIRGVENHRYRLRRKMGLERDVNLTAYVMEF